MRLVLLLFVCLFSISSFAHVVLSAKGSEVTVDISKSESLKVGEQVYFLDSSLDTVGEGDVIKVSNGGKRALINVVTGNVEAGMTFEKKFNRKEESVVSSNAFSIGHGSSGGFYGSLSEEERTILARGEISITRYVVGGILGTYPGFGVGHAVQGRYSDKGWIFTVGELGSLMVMSAGLGDCVSNSRVHGGCDNGGLIFLGLFSYVGFRIWEAVDVWAAPPELNRRYRELRSRMPASTAHMTFEPGIMPLAGGGALGLKVTF